MKRMSETGYSGKMFLAAARIHDGDVVFMSKEALTSAKPTVTYGEPSRAELVMKKYALACEGMVTHKIGESFLLHGAAELEKYKKKQKAEERRARAAEDAAALERDRQAGRDKATAREAAGEYCNVQHAARAPPFLSHHLLPHTPP